jgi:hypothetical protein
MVLSVMILSAALSTASMAVSGATPRIVGDDYLYPSCAGACTPSAPEANNPETPNTVLVPAPGSGNIRASADASPAAIAAPQLR